MRISLCIATYNEESNIHYPLDSAYDFVDEVVIVDGGSTDKTVDIAKSYGSKVKVFIESNPPMFHINKQKAIERAKGEWILQLDADEEISKELKNEIVSLLLHGFTDKPPHKSPPFKGGETGEVNNVAYYLPRKNFFLTRFLLKGGQYPDYTIRLYRNGYARFPCKTVHENVEIISQKSKVKSQKFENSATMKQWNNETLNQNKFGSGQSINNQQSTIGYLKDPILHYADPDFSRYLKRWDRYTSLEAEQLFSNNQLTINNLTMFDYFLIKPACWFFLTYFRHLGFMDGFPGFVFALFSSIRFWVIYIKVWRLENGEEN